MADGAPILVCGLGRSGMAAARLLRREGAAVTAVDSRERSRLAAAADELEALGCTVATGMELPPEGGFTQAVLSPGIPTSSPLVQALRRRGIPCISELELGWSRCGGRTIAVTGSNGKSSIVKALEAILTTAGYRAAACGNIGLPVCEAVMQNPQIDFWVMEVSSFQSVLFVDFRPDIGVVLNLLPNHLDRHGSMEEYVRCKARLFANQTPEDAALVPPEWIETLKKLSSGKGRWSTIGAADESDYGYAPGRLVSRSGLEADIRGTYFDNPVLGRNAAALLGVADALGVPSAAVEAGLRAFKPLPHRMETVAEVDGVAYINDSKATNLAALMAALRMQERPVHLIAGGRAKETDFSAAVPLLKEKAAAVYLIGEAADALAAAWTGAGIPCRQCGTLEQALAVARRAAGKGDAVLLSPACTSYDQYASYEERGAAFRAWVEGAVTAADRGHEIKD